MNKHALPFAEFVALMAILSATMAFSTDAMLPAMPEIAADLGLTDANRAQLVITAFLLGAGLGQLVMGPLSDTVGRRPVLGIGVIIFVGGCILAFTAQSLGMLLLARLIQGLGVSAHRSVVIAVVRDLYVGRSMARVMSIMMMIFVLVPAAAPSIGQVIIQGFGWRSIFLAFAIFALVGITWFYIRQPETHPVEKRRPFAISNFKSAFLDMATSRAVVIYIAIMSLGFAALFAFLSSAQQVFVDTYGAGDRFPIYFAMIALISGSAGIINATLVMRVGMRYIARTAMGILCISSVLMSLNLAFSIAPESWQFVIFMIWATSLFYMPGFCFGNLNALAMEPLGHIAGFAAAIIGAASTGISIVIAIPIGLAFDGTALPLAIGVTLCCGVGYLLFFALPKTPS